MEKYNTEDATTAYHRNSKWVRNLEGWLLQSLANIKRWRFTAAFEKAT